MNYKLVGTKYWKSYFGDLKCFDRISFIDIISRVDSTLREFKEYSSGALISFNEEYEDIPEMKELYDKFNKENSTNRITFWPEGRSPFAYKYTSKLIGSTSNYQNRDGQIVPPFERKDIYQSHVLKEKTGQIDPDYLYLAIPYEFISEYMVKTNNNWNMDIAKKFIREVKDWDDIESIDKLIDEYDKKYLNWNHDFPIFGFMSILKNGLLFPNIAFSGGVKKNGVGFNKILSDGTHRLFMPAMSGSDYPMFVQVPKNQTKFSLKTPMDIFKNKTYLKIDVDLENKKYEIFLNNHERESTKIGVVIGDL